MLVTSFWISASKEGFALRFHLKLYKYFILSFSNANSCVFSNWNETSEDLKGISIFKGNPWYAWYDTQYAKMSQTMEKKWYRKKLISLVQVRHQGHNQKIFCWKRYCREKVSCIKKTPCTIVGFSCHPLSFHLYSNLNKSEEQTWREKLILRSIGSSRIKMIDVPCTEGHLRVKAEWALGIALSLVMSHPIWNLFVAVK